MRKFFKITSIVFGVLLLLVIGLVVYLNARYNQIKERQAQELSELKPLDLIPRFVGSGHEPQLTITPYPQSLVFKSSRSFVIPSQIAFQLDDSNPDDVTSIVGRVFEDARDVSNGWLKIRKEDGIEKEGYRLDVTSSNVTIEYSDRAGLYYGLGTLKQLMNGAEEIKAMKIEDFPDMKIRGFMLDVSRNKVPTLATIKETVDDLAALKYNHFELYVEGFSFAYDSYRPLWEENYTPITAEEIRELDQYCKDRFIDLVPNQNSLGHMQAWLETEEFADLAETPEGYGLTPFMKIKTTIDPNDPRSIELLENMTRDMLPNFTSDYFNVNLDEPFELGHGKSKELAEELGVGMVYLQYVKKIYALVNSYDKQMMMWADIISKHPEIIGDLPQDIMLMEWGYERDHPFDRNSKRLSDAGFKFLVCPGTSSWTTLTGRTDNMLANITNAVSNGIKYGAEGMVLTDWGDMGHWQYWPITYAGMAYAGGLSWNSAIQSEELVSDYLNRHLFKDESGQMAQAVLELGRYNQYEELEMPNMTLTSLSYQFGMVDGALVQTVLGSMEGTFKELVDPAQFESLAMRFDRKQPFRYDELMSHLQRQEEIIDKTSFDHKDSELIKDELKNGMRMIRVGASLKDYQYQQQNLDDDQRQQRLEDLLSMTDEMISEHKRLWGVRNKSGGLDESLEKMEDLRAQLAGAKSHSENGGLGSWLENQKQILIVAAADLFLGG